MRGSHRLAPVAMLILAAAMGPMHAAQIPQPQPSKAGTGAISGVVLDAGSNTPIAGAVVVLFAQTAGNGNVRPASLGQVTDPGGRFVFTGLQVGDFTINASRLGYFDGGFGRTSQATASRRITLRDGEWFQNATISLSRQTSISGAVFDETDEPIVNIWVRAMAQMLIAGRPQWISGPVTKTDDRGVHRFAGMTPGKWIVMVPSVQGAVPADTSLAILSGETPEAIAASQASGSSATLGNAPSVALDARYRLLLGASATPPPSALGRARVYPITYYPSARSAVEAVAVDTSSGNDRSGVDIMLRPVPAFKVSGVVQGPAEATTGLVLRLMPAGSESLGPGGEAATSLVDTDGVFAFLTVPAGAYTILASRSIAAYSYNSASLLMTGSMPMPAGMTFNSMSASAVTSAAPGTMFETRSQTGPRQFNGRVQVLVRDADLANVVVPMETGVSISGHVVREAASNTPVANDAPILFVNAVAANGDPSLGQPQAAIDPKDPTLAFRIDGLQSGEYLLRVFGNGQVKSITFGGRDFTFTPFDASSAKDFSGVVITLTRETAQLNGFIHDELGRVATTNAFAVCVPAERDQWSRYGIQPSRLRTVAVASNGSYRFGSMPAGDYLVFAVDDAHADVWKDPARLATIAPLAKKVTLTWGGTVSLDLAIVGVP